MSDGMDKADELPLVCSEGAVPGRHRPAEESDGVVVLDQHYPKPWVDASHSTMNYLVKFGSARTGANMTDAFSAVNAEVASSVQEKPSFLRSVVRGAAMTPKPWANLR